MKIEYSKLLVVISLFCVILSLIIINELPPAVAYEPSIVSVYPIYFWILLSIPISMGFIKLIFFKEIDNATYLLVGISILSILIFLTLPFLRGYPIYGAGDTLSHLGMIKDIGILGHIGLKNPYPVIHLLIYGLYNITGIKPDTISLFMPQIFILLYSLSMFLLAKSLKFSLRESLFVMMFSIIPVLGTELTREYILPSVEAFFYIPFLLFIFNKSRVSKTKISYSILLVTLLMLMAFFHPEASIFLSALLITIFVCDKFRKKIKLSTKEDLNLSDKISTPFIFLIIATLAWFSSAYAFGNTVYNLYSSFILNLQEHITPVDALSSGFQVPIFNAIMIIIEKYGSLLLYLIVGAIISLFTIKNIIYKRKIDYSILILVSIFVTFIILNLMFLTKPSSIGYHVARQLKYPLLVATILFGFYFARYLKNMKFNFSSKSLLIIIIVFFLPVFTLINAYPAPNTHGMNYQITHSDIDSMNFFFTHRDKKLSALEMYPRSFQVLLAHYLYGYENSYETDGKKIDLNNLALTYDKSRLPPDHFGYSNSSSLGTYYTKPMYLLIYPPSDQYYPLAYPNLPNLWRYNSEDFKKLSNDSSLDTIYADGSFQIIIINQR